MKKDASNKKPKIKRTRKRIYESAPREETEDNHISADDLDEGKKEEIRKLETDVIIKNYWLLSMGASTIPIPLIDVVAVAGIQLKMLHKLAGLYGIEFLENRGKSIVAALIGSILPVEFSRGLVGSVAKIIPGAGLIMGMTTLPIFSGASTYAVGRVFIQHFESGGTFLDFDPEKVKRYYAEQFKRGKEKVAKAPKKTK
tara:strand:+ start:1472 stop:2068 length:597 start_codon:yes stop_codon:yes gene_type:complete